VPTVIVDNDINILSAGALKSPADDSRSPMNSVAQRIMNRPILLDPYTPTNRTPIQPKQEPVKEIVKISEEKKPVT
jgi:hypothetical protein